MTWRLIQRADGLWSLQHNQNGTWIEDRTFCDHDMATADLNYLQSKLMSSNRNE